MVGGFVLFGLKVIIAGLALSSVGRLKKAEKYAYYDEPGGDRASVQDRDELLTRDDHRRSERAGRKN